MAWADGVRWARGSRVCACAGVRPGKDVWEQSTHETMGHIVLDRLARGSLSDCRSACAFVTGVWCAWPVVYYNHCTKLCPIFRVLCAYACRMKAVCVESSTCILCFLNAWYCVLKFLAHSPWRIEKVSAAVTTLAYNISKHSKYDSCIKAFIKVSYHSCEYWDWFGFESQFLCHTF